MGKALAARGKAQSSAGVTLHVGSGAAADRVGQVVTVEGVVLRADRTPGSAGYVLSLSVTRGDGEIQVWMTPQVIARMGPPLALEGRRVRVTGALWKHDGVAPALTVAEPTQLMAIRRDGVNPAAGPALAR
jgi:hypothetical protein